MSRVVEDGDRQIVAAVRDVTHRLGRFPGHGEASAAGGLRLQRAQSEGVARVITPPLPLGLVASPITAAEQRVLRYLPTHLTLAAIADLSGSPATP